MTLLTSKRREELERRIKRGQRFSALAMREALDALDAVVHDRDELKRKYDEARVGLWSRAAFGRSRAKSDAVPPQEQN